MVNPFLAWSKYRYGKKLEAPALKFDAKDTLICQYQTLVVLAGLILTETMGWWWADPVAALAIVPYVAWEGIEATRDAWEWSLAKPAGTQDFGRSASAKRHGRRGSRPAPVTADPFSCTGPA